MKALIAGGGIGGLTTALALHQRGIECQVLESVRELAPLGVGINVLPHAMAELAALGLLDELVAEGVQTAELCFFNRHGQLIWREPRGLAAGYPVPQISVHRGRFQLLLGAAVRQRLGADALLTGHVVTSFENGADRVSVEVQDRVRGRSVALDADVLIGADGIHSAVRRQFHPDEGAPSWSGNVLWRATSQAPPFLTGRSMFMAGHRPHKFVAYPISGVGTDGLCTVNWIAELDRRAQGLTERESWNREIDRSTFASHFDDWRFDWLDIGALIASADVVYEYPMVDRDPLDSWSSGRVTLLGDAAHPMYPIGSNGASQSILDARAIADALVEEDTVPAALARYDERRRPATAAIVASNRKHGPEVVMDLAHERAPDGFRDVADVFEPGELEAVSAQYKQVAGFTVAASQTETRQTGARQTGARQTGSGQTGAGG